MAIRHMVHCRKCNREFDWNNDEGYAKMPDGSYLCSISCDLKETLEKLALALAAIEAAKETIALLVASYAATTSGMGVGDGVLNRIDRYQAEFAELVTKLEAAK